MTLGVVRKTKVYKNLNKNAHNTNFSINKVGFSCKRLVSFLLRFKTLFVFSVFKVLVFVDRLLMHRFLFLKN